MFGTKKLQEHVVALFDMSSGSVAGAHALLGTDNAPITILASERLESEVQEEMDVKRLVDDSLKGITTVATMLQKADLHKPTRIELVLASPWYVSQTRTIQYKKDAPFLCNKKLIGELIDKEINYMVANELSQFNGFGKEGTVVEKQISLIKLNGYTTTNPYNKRAQSLEIFLTLTVAPKKIIDSFIDALRHAYGVRHVALTTSPYATFVVARDYFHDADECVIIDVGEEVTDVAFIKGGLFLYQHSFPIGTFGLYHEIVTKGTHTALEARSLLETYRLGKASDTAKKKMEKAISAFSERWQRGFQEILNDGHYGFCLPDLSYIVSDPRFEGVFPVIISTDPFVQHACLKGVARPMFINETSVSPFIKTLDETIDVPLALAALFTARMM